MANSAKTISITIEEKGGAFSYFFSKIKGGKKDSEIASLRQLLTNEKARLLHVVKTKNPESIYKLAKLLGRDFKAVRYDIKFLEQLGIVELISSHKQGRERLMPVIDADQLIINVNL